MERPFKKHKKNTDFLWRDSVSSNAVVSAAQCRDYSQQGAFLLEDAFTSAEIASVLAELDPLERQAETLLREQPPAVGIARADAITFSAHLVAQSSVLAKFARHPKLRAVCAALLGPDVRLYWDQLVYKNRIRRMSFHGIKIMGTPI